MRLDRDTIVANGLAAMELSQSSMYQKGPWIYKAKVKSGTRATRNVEMECSNIPHLKAEVVARHARESEPLNVYGISRVMKASLRSQREDI
jgi:hypothetical protein